MAAPVSRSAVVLKTVKKIVVQFCPFESNVRSTREFLAKVGSEKVRSTNMNCEVITAVKHNQAEPRVDITFADGDTLVMKGANLTSQEMLTHLRSLCVAKDLQAKAAAKK